MLGPKAALDPIGLDGGCLGKGLLQTAMKQKAGGSTESGKCPEWAVGSRLSKVSKILVG